MNYLFSNSPDGQADYTANFFHQYARGVSNALLACPFFTNIEPLKTLRESGCETIRLMVRLCESTSPDALEHARALEGIQIRYFTSRTFHAKFYVLDDSALVGSANMTMGGLRRNRELSIVVSSSDEKFDDIPALFEELWEAAAILTPDALERFSSWHRTLPDTTLPPMTGIPHAEPRTINVATRKTTRERVHLQTFHRYYYETLIPNHRLVESCFVALGSRHPAYAVFDLKYEIEAFLSWVKLEFTTDENYWTFPIRKKDDILANVREHVGKWIVAEDPPRLDRAERIAKLKKIFSEPETLEAISLSELTDALTGCAAFEEQLRFTLGGRTPMLEQFKRENSLGTVKACFGHLAFGSDEFVKRIYDCIFSREYKIRHFGRSCVLELFGWINREDIPPFNNRALKALRYLGCDVKT